MTTKLFFFGAFLLMLTTSKSFGQQLKSDNWNVSIDHWEVQEMDFMGKTQTIYLGILKVKQGNRKYGEYRFYFPEMNGKLRHITIRDMDDKVLEPRLYYNLEDKSFTFYKGTDKEQSEVALKNSDTKELVLSAMLIWLKHKE